MTNEELERLAKAATGGDWRAHITRSRSPEIYTNVPPPNTPNPKIAAVILRKADAAFIAAANPATILALLSERAELLAAVGWIREIMSRLVALAAADWHAAPMSARPSIADDLARLGL